MQVNFILLSILWLCPTYVGGVWATGSPWEKNVPKEHFSLSFLHLAALNVCVIGAVLDQEENPTRYARGKRKLGVWQNGATTPPRIASVWTVRLEVIIFLSKPLLFWVYDTQAQLIFSLVSENSGQSIYWKDSVYFWRFFRMWNHERVWKNSTETLLFVSLAFSSLCVQKEKLPAHFKK